VDSSGLLGATVTKCRARWRQSSVPFKFCAHPTQVACRRAS